MKARHTPGPWVKNGLDYYGANGEKVVVSDGPSFGSKSTFPRAQANSSLIISAPELLEALENSDRQMELAGDCIEKGLYDEALLHVRSMVRNRRAVISKARGGSMTDMTPEAIKGWICRFAIKFRRWYGCTHKWDRQDFKRVCRKCGKQEAMVYHRIGDKRYSWSDRGYL